MDLFEGTLALTNDEVRRRRLGDLMVKTEHSINDIAEKAGVSGANLKHILQRYRQSKPRADKTQPQPLAAMGDKVARAIEAAYELTPGWMDWPFSNVDFEAFVKLGGSQRLIVQVRMDDAIKEQSTKKTAMRQVDRKAVTNKKVEENYRALAPGAAAAAERAAHQKSHTTTKVRSQQSRRIEPDLLGDRNK